MVETWMAGKGTVIPKDSDDEDVSEDDEDDVDEEREENDSKGNLNGEDKTPEEEREINLLAGGIAMNSPPGYGFYQRDEYAKALAKDAEYNNTTRARLFERAKSKL